MNTQINVRVPGKLLGTAKKYAKEHGFSTVQDLMKESLREKMFEEPLISKQELMLVKKLLDVSEKKKLYGTEKELFDKLKRR